MYLSKLTFAAFLSSASSFTIQCPTFTSTTATTRVASRLHSSPGSDNGWDNDNFLDALGGGQESIDNVNEAYTTESTRRSTVRDHAFSKMEFDEEETPAIFGGKVAGMPDPDSLPKSHDHNEENPSGGSYFQKMLEKAKQVEQDPSSIRTPPKSQAAPDALPPPAVPAPAVAVPVAAVPPPVPVAAVPVAANDMAVQMAMYQQQVVVWQQQMTAFGQFSVANPQAAASMTMPPPPTPPDFSGGAVAAPAAPVAAAPVAAVPPPVAAAPADPEALKNVDPKEFVPMGGNKDAYEITNPADVYLAQLKRDSNVRTEARKRGDMEVANAPFADFGVKAIGNILGEDLIARRREQLAQNGGEFETSRDEMIIPFAYEEDTRESNDTGISYRQKLEEMKKKRAGRN